MPTPPSPLPHESPQGGAPVEKSGLSKKAIITWTAIMFTALALAWFVGAVVVPVWRTRTAVVKFHRRACSGRAEGDYLGGLLLTKHFYRPLVKELGGPEKACSKLGWYVRMPAGMVPHRDCATRALGLCGKPAVAALESALTDDKGEIRWATANALEWIGSDAVEAIPALEEALKDEDEQVRTAAQRALGRIDGRYTAGQKTSVLRLAHDYLDSIVGTPGGSAKWQLALECRGDIWVVKVPKKVIPRDGPEVFYVNLATSEVGAANPEQEPK